MTMADIADGPSMELEIKALGNGVLQWLVDGQVIHEVQYKQGDNVWVYYAHNEDPCVPVWHGPVP